MGVGYSDPDGSPPEFWSPERVDDEDIIVELNDKKSFFQDDPTEDLSDRLWGAVLYTRERRMIDERKYNPTVDSPHRTLYGECYENAVASAYVFQNRGFDVDGIAVMCQHDIRDHHKGQKPEKLEDTSFRHYLIKVKVKSQCFYIDISQYRFDKYDSFPYVGKELPDVYCTFPDSEEYGELIEDQKQNFLGPEPKYL